MEWVSPWEFFVNPALLNRDNLDRWCEWGILGLVLAILVFGPLATGAVRPVDFLVIRGLTLGVLALWALRLWLNPKPQLLFPPICWAVLAFTVYALARYLTAEIEYVAREEFLRVLVYAILFCAVLNNLYRQEYVQLISVTMLFLAMAISFYALFQFVTGSNRVWNFVSPYTHRGLGTYICPNHLGGFLEMLLPLGLAYTTASRLKPVARVLVGYASLVILAGIGVSVSRGSWISTLLVLVVLFVVLALRQTHRAPALVLLALLIGGSIALIPKSIGFQMRYRELFAQGRLNDDLRFTLWRPAVQVWRENLLFGVGPAHFDYAFRRYRPELVQYRPDRIHNDYLNTLADWGIVGAALVTSAWILLGRGLMKTWRVARGARNELGESKGRNRFAFMLGASLGLLAILFHSVVDFNMNIPANAILAITLMALLSSYLRFTTEHFWIRLGVGSKLLASGVLLAGLIYLGTQESRLACECFWLQKADQAPSFSPDQVRLLEKAFAAEPKNGDTAYAIGEAFRVQSKEGGDNYQELATKAMQWFGRAIKLNPWNGDSFMRYGSCLDWIGRQDESAPYFKRAYELDPNGYFVTANIGLHYVQLGDYAAARPWLERSLRLQTGNNPIARSYLDIANRKLLEAAAAETALSTDNISP